MGIIIQMNQQIPEGYLSLDDAVRESKYSRDHLNQLARSGTLGREKIYNKLYFSAGDLTDYLHPTGFLTLKEASVATGYARRYFGNLANERTIESVRRHEKIFVPSQDVERFKLPEGYLSQEEAVAKTGFTADHLKRAANKGLIRGILHHRKVYFRRADIEGYRQPPEGYLSLNDAASSSRYSVSHLSSLAIQGRIGSVREGKRVYISTGDVENYSLIQSKKFLSLDDAVKKSEYSRGYLRELVRKGTLGRIKIGHLVYISAEDLKNYTTIPEGF